ncbi:MAG TPA: glycoside hydrolase family protein [Oscillospiraceae bacterium]|nr:glycoside hydrolase family protein [Oscillospiraceae bacterium]HPK36053.1 glycoside hydrolase family protein [Oscillospiraceae bacterium]HPR75984.1 glycoside hydrolase family protein [Oscillospiraceae bacterium]
MDFASKILPLKYRSVFSLEGFYVWGACVQKDRDGLYHMIFSKWPKEKGFKGWVTDSSFGYAVSNAPDGPYRYMHDITLLGNRAEVLHNPTMIKHGGKYWLYFMQNSGTPEGERKDALSTEWGDSHWQTHWWAHRNNQRIGAAWALHPAGPWHSSDNPVINVTPGSYDGLMVSNPAVTAGGDGNIYMVYKSVAEGVPPVGGAVVCGAAWAQNPEGPFQKFNGSIMVNPENAWSVEDPFIWYEDDRFYALVKDFHGYFTKTGTVSIALFESVDGVDWQPSKNPLAYTLDVVWEDGKTQHADLLDRPQLIFENGKPIALLCAFSSDPARSSTENIQFLLRNP